MSVDSLCAACLGALGLFGNSLFQLAFCTLLAERHGLKLQVPDGWKWRRHFIHEPSWQIVPVDYAWSLPVVADRVVLSHAGFKAWISTTQQYRELARSLRVQQLSGRQLRSSFPQVSAADIMQASPHVVGGILSNVGQISSADVMQVPLQGACQALSAAVAMPPAAEAKSLTAEAAMAATTPSAAAQAQECPVAQGEATAVHVAAQPAAVVAEAAAAAEAATAPSTLLERRPKSQPAKQKQQPHSPLQRQPNKRQKSSSQGRSGRVVAADAPHLQLAGRGLWGWFQFATAAYAPYRCRIQQLFRLKREQQLSRALQAALQQVRWQVQAAEAATETAAGAPAATTAQTAGGASICSHNSRCSTSTHLLNTGGRLVVAHVRKGDQPELLMAHHLAPSTVSCDAAAANYGNSGGGEGGGGNGGSIGAVCGDDVVSGSGEIGGGARTASAQRLQVSAGGARQSGRQQGSGRPGPVLRTAPPFEDGQGHAWDGHGCDWSTPLAWLVQALEGLELDEAKGDVLWVCTDDGELAGRPEMLLRGSSLRAWGLEEGLAGSRAVAAAAREEAAGAEGAATEAAMAAAPGAGAVGTGEAAAAAAGGGGAAAAAPAPAGKGGAAGTAAAVTAAADGGAAVAASAVTAAADGGAAAAVHVVEGAAEEAACGLVAGQEGRGCMTGCSSARRSAVPVVSWLTATTGSGGALTACCLGRCPGKSEVSDVASGGLRSCVRGSEGEPVIADWFVMSNADVLLSSNSTLSFTAAMANARPGAVFLRPDPRQGGYVEFDPWNALPLLPARGDLPANHSINKVP